MASLVYKHRSAVRTACCTKGLMAFRSTFRQNTTGSRSKQGLFEMKRVECPKCGEFHSLNVVQLPWYLKLLAPLMMRFECRECRERFLARRQLI